ALLQAHGRADITAKLHLIELPLFATCLVLAVGYFGLMGAALAWVARVALDALLLYVAVLFKFPELRKVYITVLAWVLLGSAGLGCPILPALAPSSIAIASMIFLACVAVLFVSGGWLQSQVLGKPK